MTIKHHFFGKDCIIDRELLSRANLEFRLKEIGIFGYRNLFLNQVHGRDVIVVDSEEKLYGDQGLPRADAIVTNLRNVAVCVVTADCAPVLLFDAEKKIIAAAHAGWRGAKLGIISSTIAEMKKLGAIKISAIVGPMIQQESYEVSHEFFDDFLLEDTANKEFFIGSRDRDKYLFDLSDYVEKKLCAEGIVEISNQKIDTYKNEKDLFSFRRSTHRGEKDCGRNVSFIVNA